MSHFRLRNAVTLVVATAFAILAVPAASQERGTITGTVTDATTQQPLAGVQIFLAGTQRGTLTNEQGRYAIPNVPPGTRQIRASIIGYNQGAETVDLASGGTATADFQLSQSAVELAGIVVNAVTGEQVRQRELGNAVGRVDINEVPMAVVNRPADVLMARVPGVDVRSVSGTTGTGQKIRIRGTNSINLSNEPLIVVDGVRFENNTEFFEAGFSEGAPDQTPNRLNDLNSEDIQSIEILKGPAATGIYGTAASNGVILITTKKGTSGAPRWHFYAEGGLLEDDNDFPDNIAAFRRVIGDDGEPGLAKCFNFQVASGACAQDTIARFNPFETDDFSPFQTGSRQQYGLNVSGGADQVTYFVSGDWEREDGVYTNNDLEKANLRANVRAQLRENLGLTAAVGYVTSDFLQPSNDNSVLSPILNGLLGRAVFDRDNPDRAFFRFSPEVTTEQFTALQEIERFTGSLNANWQPWSWLSLNGTAGLDVFSLHDEQILQPNVAPIAATWVIGWVEESQGNNFNYTGNVAGVATFPITPNITSTSTVGVDYNEQQLEVTRAKGFGVTPGTRSLSGTSQLFEVDEDNTRIKTLGGFIQQQFAFNDRIFVAGSLRGDDNSAFGEDLDFVVYPTASASWVIAEEPWFPQSDILSSLRLRGAVGESGQRPQFRQAVTFFSPGTAAAPAGDAPGIVIGGTGNIDLEPERTLEFEAGLDAGFFNDRVAVELTYYDRTTNDALIQRVLPPSAGQSNPLTSLTSGVQFINIGEVSNRGVEFALDTRIIDTQPFRWNVRVTGSTLDSEIDELGEGVDPIIFNRGQQKHIEGFNPGGYWQPVIDFDDADGNGLLDPSEISVADTATFIGPSIPEFNLNLSTDVQLWDWLRVSTLFDGRFGHFQLNDNERFRCLFSLVTSDRGCEAFDDPGASLERQATALALFLGDPETGVTSRAGIIEEADFVKWRELAITLSAPEAWRRRIRGLDGVSLTLAGRNLATFTDYSGLDPEVNETSSQSNFTQGEFGTQPQVRYFTARVDVNF